MTEPQTVPSSAGILLFDSRFNPIFLNRVAKQILFYPEDLETLKDVGRLLSQRLHSIFDSNESLDKLPFHCEVRSGRRLYLCRVFQEDSGLKQHGPPVVALLLERSSAGTMSLCQTFERFRLTVREQEVLVFLLQGLTSKEIAARMKISPNTVKAFLRLIMVKMGVSTRAGIVGKVATARA